MPQATVDLPDPMEGRPAPVEGGTAGADDLLDRLAGDEIDRLLAGLEEGPPPAAVVSRQWSRVDSIAAPEGRAAALPVARPTNLPPPELEPPAPAHRDPSRFEPLPEPERLPDPPSFDDAATSLAERGALEATGEDESVGLEGEAPTVDDYSEVEGTVEPAPQGAEPLPVYLRPLEWLNAPFDALPGSAREAVGKVAILALVNALAVLLYVLIFRH